MRKPTFFYHTENINFLYSNLYIDCLALLDVLNTTCQNQNFKPVFYKNSLFLKSFILIAILIINILFLHMWITC